MMMNPKISLIYDTRTLISPIGNCWSPHLEKSIPWFGKDIYKVTLGLDDHEEGVSEFYQTLNEFQKWYSTQVSMRVPNSIVYRSLRGNPYVGFKIRDKGQGPIPTFNTNGERTESPISGDRIQVRYSLAGWNDGEKAGIKVYLDSVCILDRVGTPEVEKHIVENDCDDGAWNEW